MTYVPKKQAWNHQVVALEKLEGRKFFALLMQMRTGKTKVTLDDFMRLYEADEVDDLLVIAPAGVYLTWRIAIEEHVDDELIKLMIIRHWSSAVSDMEEKLKSFISYNEKRPRVFLVNVECLSTVKRAQDILLAFCKNRRIYCVIDESTCIKTPTSKRTEFILNNVRDQCEYRRILTGLVAPKDPLDVYSQFEFLQPECLGFSTFASFTARYGIIKKRSTMRNGNKFNFVKPVGFRDQEELAFRIAWHSHRVRLADCYDLPPKIYEVRNVHLTDQQERIYKELLTFATAELENQNFVTALQAMTQILRLHQILMGHTKDENGLEHNIDSSRVNVLLETIDEWNDGEGKAIIWCAYDNDIQRVVKALERRNFKVARFWGGNRTTREDEEKQFKTDPETRFMVATAAAGGRGRTWDNADLVIYYSNTWNLEHREQSEERAQSLGKDRNVLYVDLVAVRQDGSQTVDMKVLKALREKINMAAVLSGDGWRQWVI